MSEHIKAECVTCPVHEEFAKRLDERWEAREKMQDDTNKTLFAKLDTIDTKLDKSNNRAYYLTGALVAVALLAEKLLPVIMKHISGQ